MTINQKYMKKISDIRYNLNANDITKVKEQWQNKIAGKNSRNCKAMSKK